MQDSVFSQIIKGELPSYKVYEDDKTLAILPLQPIALGHVLVISKLQIDQFYDLPTEDYQAVMATVQKVAQRLKLVIDSKRVGLKIVGLDVPHVHVHVVAFDTLAQYDQNPDSSAQPDHPALAALAKKLMF